MQKKNKRKFHPFVHQVVGVLSISLLTAFPVQAEEGLGKPILVIGASLENSVTPIDDNLIGPWGGYAVNSGSYLSLGEALVRTKELNGFVINQAEAGATSFARLRCGWYGCMTLGWQGYDVQFQKALSRVAITNPQNPAQIVGYNADYIFIGFPNDCLHSGAMGIPQSQTAPCTVSELNDVIDRLKTVAENALALGITPIFDTIPQYNVLDLPYFRQRSNLIWAISEEDLDTYRDLHRTRIQNEIPEALLVDTWEGMENIDGIHPTPESAERAAKRVAKAIRDHEKGNRH